MQGLAGLKIVGADIVEVAPGYDTQGQESTYKFPVPRVDGRYQTRLRRSQQRTLATTFLL